METELWNIDWVVFQKSPDRSFLMYYLKFGWKVVKETMVSPESILIENEFDDVIEEEDENFNRQKVVVGQYKIFVFSVG